MPSSNHKSFLVPCHFPQPIISFFFPYYFPQPILTLLKYTVHPNHFSVFYLYSILALKLLPNGSLYSKMDLRFELGMVENLGIDYSHAKINDLKIGGFGRVLPRRSLPPPLGSVLMRSSIFLKHIYNGVNILESFARVSTR